MKLRGWLLQWEAMLIACVVALIAVASATVSGFSSTFNLSLAAAGVSEVALMAIPLMLLIIAREIDLSVASIAGLTSCTLGLMIEHGVPLAPAIVAVLGLGAAAGVINGALVAYLRLPSLVVTLGTLALFRGLCYIELGPQSVSVLPASLTNVGIENVAGTPIPWTIVPFLVLAVVVGVMLHFTTVGRRIFATGGNPETARYSGIRVQRLKLALFVFSGVASAIAGIVYTARFANARADNAFGLELNVITIVFLGGVSVFGGKGSIVGVVAALLLVGLVQNVLGLKQVSGDVQSTVIGILLVGSVLLNNVARSAAEYAQSRRDIRSRAGPRARVVRG